MQKTKKRFFLREAHHMNVASMMIGAGTLVLIQIILWFAVGIPLGMFHYLRASLPLLPRWLYMLLDLFVHALLGASIGGVLCNRRCFCEVQKYRGAFYFVLAVAAGYLYYAFFFGIGFFLVSFVLACMELLGLFIAMLNFFHVMKLSAACSCIGCLWAIYRLILSFFSFFVI